MKAHSLERLRSLLQDPNPDRVRAGLTGLGELGFVDLGVTIAEMRPALRRWLLPRVAKLEGLETGRRRVENEVHKFYGSYQLRSEISNLFDKGLENELYSNLPSVFPPEKELKILMAAQYAIVGLSFAIGAIPVMRELKLWLPAGKADMARLLALLFLRPQGMAEVLERFTVCWREDTGTEERWSPILVSATLEEKGVEHLTDFLFEIYLGASQLPHVFERALVARWMSLIEIWTRQAAKGSKCREHVIALWCRLLRAHDLELRQKLGDLLNHPELGVPGTKLGELVEVIRNRHAEEKARRRLTV
ncbi:MAG: hypothetical protein HC897_03340 [Thermoanaerobaculia bacterium]|nr:hypothetical protein [Thermoanaerobaculia bacterium]